MALADVLLFCSGTRAPTGEGPVGTVEIRILRNYGLGETFVETALEKAW